ncbi:mitotic spindle checkpoint protein BUB3, WD repeat superfamily [Scheffersomyces amazonensis]|uniref:mitotic spindle checkpoint protein BUB3, WD repeat superfamily n=1 Tax=Scheffersomyces amazonensis TaxID=1078765 RepID=UPI00315D644C
MALTVPRDHEILPAGQDQDQNDGNIMTNMAARTYLDDDTAALQVHHFELSSSESLNFLYNLLYDDQSCLSKSDILRILNSIKTRENDLPFSISNSTLTNKRTDLQGIYWPRDLRKRFFMDRSRIGKDNWFHNIPDSRYLATNKLSIKSFNINTEFFKFHRFFSKLKLHLTHLQLRNLVCCGTNVANGIYYPSSYYHDYNLETVPHDISFRDDDCYHTFFKINRLMPDNSIDKDRLPSQSMKVDCLIDSRQLQKNSNSRISTLAATNSLLVTGIFEGGYILSDISDANNVKLLGEYHLTSNEDGITNHVLINEIDNELIISSNDRQLRIVDLNTNRLTEDISFTFPVNCSVINPFNSNEVFISGDSKCSFIVDKRHNSIQQYQRFIGHEDFGFCCDWSNSNENLLLTGNQDTTVKLWDRRKSDEFLYSWSGSLGSDTSTGCGPVRNCRFSYNGEFIAWAESLDHVGILRMDDLSKINNKTLSRVQSIDFIGKCTALNFAPMEYGYGEQLIIGVNDCPLGGILSYKLESREKPLDFDFYF